MRIFKLSNYDIFNVNISFFSLFVILNSTCFAAFAILGAMLIIGWEKGLCTPKRDVVKLDNYIENYYLIIIRSNKIDILGLNFWDRRNINFDKSLYYCNIMIE